MPLARWWSKTVPLPGAPAAAALEVDAASWLAAAGDVAAAGGHLLALWVTLGGVGGAPAAVRAAFMIDGGLLVAQLLLSDLQGRYRGLQELFPCAARMQRAAFDLTGVAANDRDQRPWLRHAAWPAGFHPLRDRASDEREASAVAVDTYPFVRVEGDGVHEIPVGPVHAGIIEPGHFRFSVVGEKVLRLEQRLGYVHKGIEQRFTELSLLDGCRLAARVSGDSAVAYSWAYCQALEALTRSDVPPRALFLRALCLELERLQNHLGDLGALGNDAGFAFGLTQFSRLKEELLRATQAALGQRYLLDAVVPGGVARDLAAGAAPVLLRATADIARAARELRQIYDEHAGVRDRFVGAGVVDRALAQRLGLIGLAGRASGIALDLRADRPWPPYDVLAAVKCGVGAGDGGTDRVAGSASDGGKDSAKGWAIDGAKVSTKVSATSSATSSTKVSGKDSVGDVAARVAVRFDEVQESCWLVARILAALPAGPIRAAVLTPTAPMLGVGLIEGWRGPVLVALEVAAGGAIHRCHPHDPSWQNWPVLEHAIIDNIVPDFPLINKSFNLSYSGHDL